MKYIDYLNKILEAIEKAEVFDYPFPHMVLEVPYDTLDMKGHETNYMARMSGREIYSFVLLKDEMLDSKIEEIGNLIEKKLNIDKPIVYNENNFLKKTQYSEIWNDGSELDIQEIHLDYLIKNNMIYDGVNCKSIQVNDKTQTVYSMHIYIPSDDNHIELGTSIYSEPTADELKSKLKKSIGSDDYMKYISHKADYPIELFTMIKKQYNSFMKKEKTIPYKPGVIFIHNTTLKSWHSAPSVPEGYIRKSIMTRWDYTIVEPELA